MPPAQSRRGALSGSSQRTTNRDCHRNVLVLCIIIFISVVGSSYYLTKQDGRFSTRQIYPVDDSSDTFRLEENRRRTALEQVEGLSQKETRDVKSSTNRTSGPLKGNIASQNALSSSWVQEDAVDVSRKVSDAQQDRRFGPEKQTSDSGSKDNTGGAWKDVERADFTKAAIKDERLEIGPGSKVAQVSEFSQLESERLKTGGYHFVVKEDDLLDSEAGDGDIKQVTHTNDDLSTKDEIQSKQLETEAFEGAKIVEVGSMSKVWQSKVLSANSDNNVQLMRNQLIMARAYTNIAMIHHNPRLVRDLKYRIKENLKVLEDVTVDSELPRGSHDKMKAMGQLLEKVKGIHYDDKALVKKLSAMLHTAEDELRNYKKQSNFLSQVAAKTVPKGLHCLSMRLTVNYNGLSPHERDFQNTTNLEDISLYHYALFSDNVLAVAVVVNSTVMNANEPEKHVFHVVTDTLNYGAMKMWFLNNPPGKATIQVQNVDEFKWLNSSYCPVLKQLETESMKDYFFKSDKEKVSANLKYRNPKYLSMLNHLRFYLPEVYSKLDKILFLDDDVVVLKDLTPLWAVDLKGNVNGAVETCGTSFHRFDKYLNFSNPLIATNFNPRACGWAYGMNIFDLKEWSKRDITGIYHKWQTLNADRALWKLGTLPPGLITFYNMTYPLEKSWHVLGLGYNPNTVISDIEAAAVVHYNGNMKPWLEIGISKFKPYWSKYVKYDHPWLQQCNISE